MTRVAARHRRQGTIGGRRAFTLVEMIAAMAILGLVASIAAGIIVRASESFRTGAMRARLHAELAAGMDLVERTIREIPLNAGGTAPAITRTSATQIQWTAGAGTASISSTFTDLQHNPGTGAVTILTEVSAFQLQFFNESNARIGPSLSGTACGPIRRVEVTVTMTRGGISETLRTRVFLRCMTRGSGT